MHARGQLPGLTCRGKKNNDRTRTRTHFYTHGQERLPDLLVLHEEPRRRGTAWKIHVGLSPCSCYDCCWCSGSHCFAFNVIHSFIHSCIHPLWVIVILRIRLMQSCKLSPYCAGVSLFSAIIYSLSQPGMYMVSFVIKFKHQKKKKKRLSEV